MIDELTTTTPKKERLRRFFFTREKGAQSI